MGSHDTSREHLTSSLDYWRVDYEAYGVKASIKDILNA
ncbi:hypothetical protein CHITON_0873 [Thermococcus chitonophagus]|uniref:Uncharacterized protein n=1 Tax=Thermococcus chitonophagus TaxID=54262 RepID=A0A160VS29_9EURY|nr:hypothetical protein CHITON_0873 [Thermococcus chitonophagus]